MIGRALDLFVPWRMRRVRFTGQAADGPALTSRIVDAFLAGARPGFVGAPDLARGAEHAIPWHARPFYWEGHAFGCAARHAARLASGNPRPAFAAPGYGFMFYTGVGFWNGVAPRFLAPRVSLDPVRWADVPGFGAHRALLAGGASFGALTLGGAMDGAVLRGLSTGERWWDHGLRQGAGRAAWFLHMRDPQRLAHVLDFADPADVGGVAEGIGLAIAFTQLSEPDRILGVVDALPARHQRLVRGGVRAALGVAAVDDPRMVQDLAALPAPLDRWADQGAAVVGAAVLADDLPAAIASAIHDFD